MEPRPLWKKVATALFRISLCLLILLAGIYGMKTLAALKKPPKEAVFKERPLRVEAVTATPGDVPVFITGFGETRAVNTVMVAAEAAGRIVRIHPRLEKGEVIEKGELLFTVDPSTYKALADEAAASVSMLESTLLLVKKQQAYDSDRLVTLRRNRDLAESEFKRVKKLFEKDRVGTRSGMDAAEQAFNSARDTADLLSRTVGLYPIRIQEAGSNLAAARARRDSARINLGRTAVKAPFRCRVKAVSLEAGQYVTPGKEVLTLADDAVLEIHVPVDSRDAGKWLRFDKGKEGRSTAWFTGLYPAPCTVSWTEGGKAHTWRARLHRVVTFDAETRTLTVAVRIPAENALSGAPERLPLVEGMFCSVSIPGKTMSRVIPLPRWAVSFQNTVYVDNEGRLETRKVVPARTEGETTYITEGLRKGERVITTRLIDPLENSKLFIINRDSGS